MSKAAIPTPKPKYRRILLKLSGEALRAAGLLANEIGADVILKATRVDGIYTADPMKDPEAKKFQSLTHGEALQRRLNVMDSTAFSLCQDNRMPIIVFDFFAPDSLRQAV